MQQLLCTSRDRKINNSTKTKQEIEKAWHDKLLSQKNCKWHINIDKTALFHKVFEKIAPLVMKKYVLKDENTATRGFKTTPKNGAWKKTL